MQVFFLSSVINGSIRAAIFVWHFGCLTPSLPWGYLKTTHKSAKFETHKPFCLLFHAGIERISIEMCGIENRCYRTRKYTVCRGIRASFSPEILQAGAVKGLKVKKKVGDLSTYKWCYEPGLIALFALHTTSLPEKMNVMSGAVCSSNCSFYPSCPIPTVFQPWLSDPAWLIFPSHCPFSSRQYIYIYI